MKTLARSVALMLIAVLLLALLAVAQPVPPQAALQVGDRAPDLKLQASDGAEYELAQFTGKKAVALCWFPRAGSQGAKIQCAALEAVMSGIPRDKLQVFGCSTATLDVTTAFAQDGKYSFPVLSDFDRTAAQAYGCLRPDGLSERWTFLIDDQGIIMAVSKSITPQTQGTELLKMLVDAGLVEAGAGVVPAVPTGDQQITLQVGDQTRTCLVHVPPAYDAARQLPLVIALHGARGNGQGMAGTTGFSALADTYAFIAAYPDGIAADRTWNALFGQIPGGEGILADDVDDIAFLRALIESLHNTHHTDPARVFVCGHSAGAYMSYRAAVELPDLVAAVGVVNGSLGIKSLDGVPCGASIPTPVAPVSLIHICGRQDNVVKFDGAQTPKNLYKSVLDCVQFFVQANECATPGQATNNPVAGVTRTLYSGGEGGTEVELVIVENCNHNWPIPQYGLSASQALWDFFAAHPKAEPAAAATTPQLVPGSTFTIEFPQMPPTLAELLDPKGIPPTMSVFLPRNYDPQRKHPLLLFLQGGDGTRGTSPSYPQMIAEEQDFVCVVLPLFKESVDPAAPANTPPVMIIRDADGKFAWPLYREMLARLEEAVPNLDPDHRILGGFSNGAHMVGEMIDQSDGEIARQFSAFFLVEGGGRMQRYDLLKGKSLLLMYGSPQALNRIQQMYDSATAAGVKATIHEMSGVGHAFPPEQFPAVREWLRGPGLE